ncbi:MAG: hypothetical protein J5616_02745 [Bacteroidaceae bacterium]|nr:hypothetical protein [Bacteroidaceae bacterium]
MKDHFVIGSDGQWDIQDVPEQYTEKAFYVKDRMSDVSKCYFSEAGSIFPVRDVRRLLQYAYDMNHVIAVLQELRDMRENGHEMCLEDSVYGIMIMNHLKILKEKAMKVWIALHEVTKNNENPFYVEVGITHQMKELDLSSEIEQYLTSIWMIYEKMMEWIESCTKTIDSLILFFTQDCEIYRQFFINGYQDYWKTYRQKLSDRLLTELYREDMFGEKILSIGKKPTPEHWGRALELKLAKLKEDPTYSFMELFHRADKMFELTVPPNLPNVVINRIGFSMGNGEIEDLSFDRNIRVFYRHMAEINILKSKITGEIITTTNGFAINDSVLNLLDELVKTAIKAHPKSRKHILMPVRAGKEAEMLPMVDLSWVNTRYNLHLTPMNWSTWVNKQNANYDARELNPLISRFQALKQHDN